MRRRMSQWEWPSPSSWPQAPNCLPEAWSLERASAPGALCRTTKESGAARSKRLGPPAPASWKPIPCQRIVHARPGDTKSKVFLKSRVHTTRFSEKDSAIGTSAWQGCNWPFSQLKTSSESRRAAMNMRQNAGRMQTPPSHVAPEKLLAQ